LDGSGRGGAANYRLSHRRELSADARVIIALMRKQPQKLEDLCKSAGIHRSTFYRLRPLLTAEGILRETGRGYTLWPYTELDERVERALEEYKEMGYRQVALSDLANKIGEPPTAIEGPAYRLAARHGLEIGEESRRREPTTSLRRAY